VHLSTGRVEGVSLLSVAGEVKVLVCTDHVSRGIDMSSVKHVIQAEFAENVVQYIHRSVLLVSLLICILTVLACAYVC
jgi:hypothetical protein